jgi:hypothetical protein
MLTLKPGERATRALGMNPRAVIPESGSAGSFLARGASRAAEAGIDGAALAAMGGGDPVKTAAYTAGIQAGGSVALALKGSILRNPVKSFFTLYLGHEMFKALAPGPQDLFTSKDSAVNEMVAAFVAGTTAAALGAGRGVGEGSVRALTDAMSTSSRGAIASVVTQLQEAKNNGDETPARVLGLMTANPDHFGADVRERIERAASSEKPQALLNEIDSLMGSTGFKEALESDPPHGPRAPTAWEIRHEPTDWRDENGVSQLPKPSFADWLKTGRGN